MFSKTMPARVCLPDLDVGVLGPVIPWLTAATGLPAATRSPTCTLGTTCLKIQTLRSRASIFTVPPKT